jgi:hypothetical protein
MIKVYIGELIPDCPHTEILFPNLGNKERETPFGETVFGDFTEKMVEIVKKPEEADYFCLPHNYNYVKTKIEYLAEFALLAETHSKKILIFFPGDSDEEVPIEHAIIFRNSQYTSKKKENEIIMPGYAVDLGKKYGLLERKKGEKPVIGFCGWANYRTFKQMLSHTLSNITESLVGNPSRKKGLHFRRRALGILKKSQKVLTFFIIRSSYSLNEKTLSVEPALARKEYVENIKNSDFTLAPKGDGNFSVRFFESLSLGRIPLLIDTETILPLECEINYDEFILRVNYRELDTIADRAAEYYAALTPEVYLEKQKKCREVFDKYLRIDVFFKRTISKEFLL